MTNILLDVDTVNGYKARIAELEEDWTTVTKSANKIRAERDMYRRTIIDFMYENDGCTLNLEPLMHALGKGRL